jgi:hypothetical protein
LDILDNADALIGINDPIPDLQRIHSDPIIPDWRPGVNVYPARPLTDNSLFINIVALTVKEDVGHEENISAE